MTPADAMVEQVARAIYEEAPMGNFAWANINHAKYERKARAAIAAYKAALQETGLVVVPRADLERAAVALDDWATVYADDMSDEKHVAEAKTRVGEYGVLSYIIGARQPLDDALAAASPAPKDTKEGG